MTDEIDWSLPARLRRIAQVFGDALNIEAADRIEKLENELSAVKIALANCSTMAGRMEPSVCQACNGIGEVPAPEEVSELRVANCPECKGTGTLR